ncbi:GyrI-like domain-containing protein [Wandonia haliotis]|uniref:GyrI-like domain-containing protein n=1 Tax=Wandonia haliotis TaxID=574963 RepID=A0ABP3Y5J0_9FLAO
MEKVSISPFHIIGISVRTTNENGQSTKDIPALWEQFMQEQILEKIPNKLDNTVYCMYTDYEKDHTRPYTTLIGCRVSSLDEIPENMTGKTISAAPYHKYTVKGNLQQNIVYNAWLKIWNEDLKRSYTADFEMYDPTKQTPENAEVEIFIAVDPEVK